MLFNPSKFYGQNFLVNKGIAAKIIAAAQLAKDDVVLEAGPGMGALTEELVKRAGRVIAVEKDQKLFKLLQEKFRSADNLDLFNADILNPKPNIYDLKSNFKIVANIPYNITGAFFQKFLLGRSRPEMIVVMVQKEVGDKLLGRGSRTLLTLAAELYGKTEKICDVSPGSFRPAPKVASMVIKMVKSPSSPLFKRETQGDLIPFSKGEEDLELKIMRLARLGFVNKRKKLATNLSTGLKISKEKIGRIFAAAGIGENARAEELNKDDWLKLAKNIGN